MYKGCAFIICTCYITAPIRDRYASVKYIIGLIIYLNIIRDVINAKNSKNMKLNIEREI